MNDDEKMATPLNDFLSAPVPNWEQVIEQSHSLDPEDWTGIKDLGHKMIEDMVSYLEHIDTEPVWRKPPDELKDYLRNTWETEGKDVEQLYEDYKKYILPYPKGNIHPRFWSWVQGTGSITAALADFLASVLNSNLAIGDHAAMYVEKQVIGWCADMFDMDKDETSGILLSGGSMANITGLLVARNAHDPKIRMEGIQGRSKKLVFYASSETHSCQQKAAEVMGLGSAGLHKIPINELYQMDCTALEARIQKDLASGQEPFAIVANVGTVNTGASDDLIEIEKICRKYNLWFHVDGAFGALAYLLPEYKKILEPMSRADSIAFDLHKWMYLPYEVGCLLVKDKTKHRNAFASQPSYLLSHERGLSSGPDPIGNYGMELSRGFKALKVWFCFQEHGRKKYEDLIRQNISQCQYLADRILKQQELELMAPVPMNIVCFRYRKEGLRTEELNQLNKEILMQVHELAIATPSSTVLQGNYVIRVAHVNHRTKIKDFDALIDAVLEIGRRLSNTN
ncbi:MAG: aminotransferase class V-fold PLP-dependent enzyme [Saprospiraceae bacterium]